MVSPHWSPYAPSGWPLVIHDDLRIRDGATVMATRSGDGPELPLQLLTQRGGRVSHCLGCCHYLPSYLDRLRGGSLCRGQALSTIGIRARVHHSATGVGGGGCCSQGTLAKVDMASDLSSLGCDTNCCKYELEHKWFWTAGG
jgi:hypothetical protein